MARERSEDALTWNVFRHMDAGERLAPWLHTLGFENAGDQVRAHFWSCDSEDGHPLQSLTDARAAFKERPRHESEPDLIISTPKAYVWVEAKFTSTNRTVPSDPAGAMARYTRGANGWFSQVVTSTFQQVAVDAKRYELLRLWLLGTWVAEAHDKQFELINLVREGQELDVEGFAAKHFRQTPARRVRRVTWESMYEFLTTLPDRTDDDAAVMSYLREKSMGYDRMGNLRRAFAIPAH
jgi:hypothetical protein